MAGHSKWSNIKAAGPDGTEREIAVMEIRIN